MGRSASGVKGIRLIGDDHVVGMVVADPEATLLTACANGYGKRTLFGPNLDAAGLEAAPEPDDPAGDPDADEQAGEEGMGEEEAEIEEGAESEDGPEGEGGEEISSQHHYRTQRRGGKGLRDIKTTPRNGPVIGIVRVRDGDELLMMTARGKIQRIPAGDVSIIGRNTQGVKIMRLDEGDTLVAVKRVPQEEQNEQRDEA